MLGFGLRFSVSLLPSRHLSFEDQIAGSLWHEVQDLGPLSPDIQPVRQKSTQQREQGHV